MLGNHWFSQCFRSSPVRLPDREAPQSLFLRWWPKLRTTGMAAEFTGVGNLSFQPRCSSSQQPAACGGLSWHMKSTYHLRRATVPIHRCMCNSSSEPRPTNVVCPRSCMESLTDVITCNILMSSLPDHCAAWDLLFQPMCGPSPPAARLLLGLPRPHRQVNGMLLWYVMERGR